MEKARLTIIGSGAFEHPLGDQTPIDCRYCELIDSERLPHRQIMRLSELSMVHYGDLVNPRAVIVWNLAGQDLAVIPTAEQAAAIARQCVLVGIGEDNLHPNGWQLLRPAEPGSKLGGNTTLWLPPGARVVLRPAYDDCDPIPVRTLVIPGHG